MEFKAGIFNSSLTDRFPKLPGGRGAPTLTGLIENSMVEILKSKERIMYVVNSSSVKTMLTWVINGSGLPKVGGGRS